MSDLTGQSLLYIFAYAEHANLQLTRMDDGRNSVI